MGGLAAIAAILGAAPGLDREQGGELDLVGRMPAAVGVLGLPEEVEEGEIEERADFLPGPVGSYFVIPAKAGIPLLFGLGFASGTPAFAGVTKWLGAGRA